MSDVVKVLALSWNLSSKLDEMFQLLVISAIYEPWGSIKCILKKQSSVVSYSRLVNLTLDVFPISVVSIFSKHKIVIQTG